MNNIILKLVQSILSNPITIIFIILIIGYSVSNVLKNNSLYDFISNYLKTSNENHNSSQIYIYTQKKYSEYKKENNYANINIPSFIEEVTSELKYKNNFILEEIKSIKNSSSICILLGVLGTFIGLSMMLMTINTNDIINSLPNTINNMQTAFITSIFGIICSLVINFMIKRRNCEYILVQLMLKLENSLTVDITNKKEEQINYKIEDIKDSIKQISESIKSIEKFEKISKDLNEFNEAFISGIDALKILLEGSHSSIKVFDQDVRKLDKQFNILNIKFNKIFDKYDNQEEINNEILLDIKETSRNIFNNTENQHKIKDYIKNISASIGVYERNVQDLVTKLVSHEENVMSRQNELSKEKVKLDVSINNLLNTIHLSSNNLEDKLTMIFDCLDLYDCTSEEELSQEAKESYIVEDELMEDTLYDK